MSVVAQDLRYGIRVLRRSPGVTLLAVLCLTLAIGSNAAVYSWIEGILLRPYAMVANQDRLMVLVGHVAGDPGHDAVSWPDFVDLRRESTLFSAFVAEKLTSTSITTNERAQRVTGSVVSANYFDAIGVHPIIGRGFRPDEEVGDRSHPVVVIGWQLWQDHFAGDPAVVGKTLDLNGVPHTVVGVTPEAFHGTFVGYTFEWWVPASMEGLFDPTGYKLEDRGARWIEGFALPKPGVTRQQAQAELDAITTRLARLYPESDRGRSMELVPLWQSPFNGASRLGPALRIALLVVVLVLLIACANVGNLLLVCALSRQRELTVRLALGAARVRLVRQLLTEGALLSAVSLGAGIVVAWWARHAIVLFFPASAGVSYNLPAKIDWRVIALSGGACVAATMLFALVPALLTTRIDLAKSLRGGAGGVVGAGGRAWLRSAFVLVQLSLSFLLVVSAGLLLRSMKNMQAADPGFSTHRTVMTAVDLLSAGYSKERARKFDDDLLERVQSLGGVESAALARVVPFSVRGPSVAQIEVDGYTPAPNERPSAEYDEVTPGFFATLGIPLERGREFRREDSDTMPLVAIVNQTMAAKYWPSRDPVGMRVKVGSEWARIIGVARNARYSSLQEAPKPYFYVPLRQRFSVASVLLVRTALPPEAIAGPITRAMHSLDATVPTYEVITMGEEVARTETGAHVAVTLLSVFGGIALFLAVIGLYGVMSYAVSQSSRELGLRVALGAAAPDVLRLVVGKGILLAASGVVAGAVCAVGVTRLMGDLLYEVSPRDPLAFGVAGMALLIAALIACSVPAMRAVRADPLEALRAD